MAKNEQIRIIYDAYDDHRLMEEIKRMKTAIDEAVVPDPLIIANLKVAIKVLMNRYRTITEILMEREKQTLEEV